MANKLKLWVKNAPFHYMEVTPETYKAMLDALALVRCGMTPGITAILASNAWDLEPSYDGIGNEHPGSEDILDVLRYLAKEDLKIPDLIKIL